MPPLAVAALCAAGAGALFLFLIFPAARRHPDRALLEGRFIAHRGLHGPGRPENSLAAFRAAAEAGFAIETDLRLTADGRVVVFHDETLDRMCGVSGRPGRLTLDRLRELRLAGTGQRVPTLEELLAEVDGRVPLLIEYKCGASAGFRLCRTAETLLRGYGGPYLVQSFYPTVGLWYRFRRRAVCRGVLSSGFPGGSVLLKPLGWLIFNALARPDFVSYEAVSGAHPCRRLVTRLGAFPVGWTFRSADEVARGRRWFRTFIFEGFDPRRP